MTQIGKWIQKWTVPSSNGGGDYTVSLSDHDTYGCSCPRWKFRREECHHIHLVKAGGGGAETAAKRPDYVLARVRKPTYDAATNRLLIPLIGIPDACLMEATICYYLLKYGYSWREVKLLRVHLPSSWTAKAVLHHIATHGEAEYPRSWYQT